MANTVIGTNGTHERVERYNDAIVKLMRPSMKIRNTFSRDYIGSPVAGAVKVPVRNVDVVVSDYDVKNGASLTQSATTYKNIPIEHDKAINELIDRYEAEAVPDNLLAQRLESGAYSSAKVLELDAIAQLLTGTASTMADCTTANVYSNIVADIAKIAKKGVDKSKMYVAISYETEILLLTDEKYSNTASQIGAELAREGVVGRINGVNVIVEDLGSTSDNKAIEYIVYATEWCQAIDEFTDAIQVNNIADGAHINASALQGRFVYQDVVTDTNAVIYKANSTATV